MGRSAAGWLLASALAPGFALLAAPHAAVSQGLVVRDGTLGSGDRAVGPGVDPTGMDATYLITPEMGEQRGSNLFHSFASFGIGQDETATFTGPDPIDGPQRVSNVISRVTGGDPSEIDGTLRSTIPGADLWLLNPSGVVFGQGAQLDVPGSFHASTGDYLGFGESDLVRFYADPSRPNVLSTARPEAFGFLGERAPAPITVTGARLGTVRPGDGLELVGGDVALTGAELIAPGGVISIRGGQIVVQEDSKVLAESAGEDPAGTITVDASESLLVDDSLLSVNTSSAGNAGTIDLRGEAIILQNGGPGLVDFGSLPSDPGPHRTKVGARAETSGSGAAGRIEIHADSVEVLDGAGLSAQTVGADGALASGAGGVVQIVAADSVLVRDRGFVSVESWGSSGDAGAIEIEAGGKLTLDGDWLTTLTAGSVAPTSRFVNSGERALGRPGTIEITAEFVELLNGGIIQSICSNCVATRSSADDFASGGGQIHITAGSMLADGTGTLEPLVGVPNQRERFGIGSAVSVVTFGNEGDAGRIVLDLTGALNLRGGALLQASAFEGATGKGGLVSVHADSVLIDAAPISGGEGFRGTGIAVQGITGDTGKVVIGARSLVFGSERASWNSFILATTSGSGKGGTIEIGTKEMPVESVVIGQTGSITAETSGAGDAGTVTVRANTVRIGPGQPAFITASSSGPGRAGTIDVVATDSIVLTNEGGEKHPLLEALVGGFFTGIFSATVLGGDGGSITLNAPEITVTDGATVATSTVGGGNAGTLLLSGDHIRIANGGSVDSTSLPHPGTGQRSLDAGSVTLEATASIEVVGGHPEFGVGRVSSLSLGSGAAGAVTLRAPRILVDAGAVVTTALRSGDRPSREGQEGTQGGDITIDAEELLVTNGGQVDASTFIGGPGGSIDVTAGSSIRVAGAGSGIASRTGARGEGDEVTLRAPLIALEDGGEVSAESAPGLGEVGRILAGAVEDRLIGLPPASATGNAGAIALAADKLLLAGGTIATNAEAADGGDITIQAKQLVHLDAGEITASVNGGAGGNITIDPEVVVLQNGSRIVAQAAGGSGGNIVIEADNYFAFPDSEVSAEAADRQELSGTVEVNTPDVNLAGTLTVLPASYLDAASLMREPCAARRSGERAGSFAVRPYDGIPPEPDGWLPATVGYEVVPELTTALARPTAPLLASQGCR